LHLAVEHFVISAKNRGQALPLLLAVHPAENITAYRVVVTFRERYKCSQSPQDERAE
jgi:hypothetical protein